MKKVNREINIFSMSALDLFASALGAFILLGVLLLPYFPNTGDSQERVDEIRALLQEQIEENARIRALLQEQMEENARQAEQIETLRGRTIKEHLDFVIVLDKTGSMRDTISAIKDEMKVLISSLHKFAPSLGVGVVAYGDRCESRFIFAYPLSRISSPDDISRLQEFIDAIQPGGGGCNDDLPEALADALRESTGMDFRPEAEKKVIVVIADAPGYPEDEQEVMEMAARFSAPGDGEVSTITNNPGVMDYMKRLADAGNGKAIIGAGGGISVLETLLD